MDPKEIVARVRGDIIPTSEDLFKINSDSTKKESEHSSQLSLAHEAICNKRVSLTDEGCWVVIGSDGVTPYAVRLFPKETCSCSAVLSFDGLQVEDRAKCRIFYYYKTKYDITWSEIKKKE